MKDLLIVFIGLFSGLFLLVGTIWNLIIYIILIIEKFKNKMY